MPTPAVAVQRAGVDPGQRGKGQRYPAAFQPRDSGLGCAQASGKLRLRQLRRRAGANQLLNQRILFVGPRVFLPELRVLSSA